MKFTELNINPQIIEALNEINYFEMTEIQSKAIPRIIEGADIVARSQTGSGKTLAFGLPMIQKVDITNDFIQGLVLCPTRELAMQVADELRKLTTKINSAAILCVYGGSDITRQIKALKKRPKIVIGTPGRVIDHLRRKTLKINNITTFVLDEADEMLNMGFKEDIEQILESVPPKRQTLMFSATFSKDIKLIISKYLTNPVTIEIGRENQSLNNIKQQYLRVEPKAKGDAFLNIIKSTKPNISIVFCNTKSMTEKTKDLLVKNGYNAVALHGDMRQRERTSVMKEVKNSQNIFLVATDVAARGIDINNVDYIFNYDIPNNVEYYLHRIGRTARAGKAGNAITLINKSDQLKLLKDFEKQTNSNITELGKSENKEKSFATENKEFYSKGRTSQNHENNFKKGFGSKDARGKGFRDKEFGNRESGGKRFGDKEFGNKESGVKSFRDKDFKNKESGNKDFRSKGPESKGNRNENFRGKETQNKGFGNKEGGSKGFRNKETRSKETGNKDFRSKESESKGFRDKTYKNKETSNKEFEGKKLKNKEFGNQGFKSKESKGKNFKGKGTGKGKLFS